METKTLENNVAELLNLNERDQQIYADALQNVRKGREFEDFTVNFMTAMHNEAMKNSK